MVETEPENEFNRKVLERDRARKGVQVLGRGAPRYIKTGAKR